MHIPRPLAEAAFRFSLLAPALDPAATPAARRAWRRSVLRRPHEHPWRGPIKVSARTLRRWERDYRQHGLEGLCPRPRKDRGPRYLTEEVLAQAEVLLRENPRRNTEMLLQELALEFPQFAGLVARSTLNRHLNARGVSRRVPQEETSVPGPPFRAFEAPCPNALWHSDIHHGPPAIDRDGKVVQTRIIAWIDDYSRACCHCEAYAHDNYDALLDAWRKAMEKFGICERTITDNGSVYTGLRFLLVCADLHISPSYTAVAAPWMNGKMERLWGVMDAQFFSEIALLPPMPIAKLNRYLRAWVEAEYHVRKHSQTGETPLARWESRRPAARYPSPEQIQRLFWLWERRRVSTTGVVQLFTNKYNVDPVLAHKKVVVRYDPQDLTRVHIWDTGKQPRWLCEATTTELLVRRRENPPPPKDVLKLSPAAQRRLEAIEARFQEHLARTVGLTQFKTQEESH